MIKKEEIFPPIEYKNLLYELIEGNNNYLQELILQGNKELYKYFIIYKYREELNGILKVIPNTHPYRVSVIKQIEERKAELKECTINESNSDHIQKILTQYLDYNKNIRDLVVHAKNKLQEVAKEREDLCGVIEHYLFIYKTCNRDNITIDTIVNLDSQYQDLNKQYYETKVINNPPYRALIQLFKECKELEVLYIIII